MASSLSVEELTSLLASANARADSERARAETLAKEVFFTSMRAISSSSAADTSSRSDVARRGAPEPCVDVGDVLNEGFPLSDETAVCDAWASFCARHAASWKRPKGAKVKENRDVHPTIQWLLEAIVHAPSPALRVWHDAAAPDDIKRAHVRPDFTLTVLRDAAPSTIGAALFVEVKKPGHIDDAVCQACTYARRRVFKLCCEADARGEPLDGIFAFAAATDGAHVVIVRVSSGAPRAGESFENVTPCPILQSAPLPLFHSWDFLAQPTFGKSSGVPDGFRALWRLCASPLSLGGATELLTKLSVTLTNDAAGCATESAAEGATVGAREVTLQLGERLGCGGISDVYVVSEDGGGWGGVGCVAKLARVATLGIVAEFDAERSVLLAMAAAAIAGLVPTCVAHGTRAPDGARARAGDAAGASPWPVLVLRPRGLPLAAWVKVCVDAAATAAGEGGAAAAAAAQRIKCADAVALRLLDALGAAHAAGWVHCDVRPSNIVVAEGSAVLVDWGCARKVDSSPHLKNHGVAAFADSRIFTGGCGVAVAPAVDVVAMLYTWLAIAHGDGCVAPWGETGEHSLLFCERTRCVAALAARCAHAGAVERGIFELREKGAEVAADRGSAADRIARACLTHT